MSTTVEAIYEAGVLRLTQPIDLADGARVDVIVIPRPPAEPARPDEDEPYKTPAEIMAEIAALANPNDQPTQDARHHDEILYGWKKSP